MILLYVLSAIVVVVVIWAVASSINNKSAVSTPTYETPPPPVSTFKPDLTEPRARSWEEGSKTSVSKSFGKGGEPIGKSIDVGGLAVTSKKAVDEEFERLKNARAFEPRVLPKELIEADKSNE
ncbi:MAG TPA: hypothetical protein ENN67_08570 [Firmicutes bacterium]|nr:hypothetical protein [Bacillota bacterium]